MKTNYHTHTTRCNHAIGSDEAYVKSAIKGGYKILGFSDHAPWSYDSDFTPRIRMKLEEFDNYYNSINHLKEKYKDQITILIGLEAEYFPKYMDWMKEFVKEKHIDYLIFGNHYYESDEFGIYYGYECTKDEILIKYKEDVKAGLKTGMYKYLAHPDLFMRSRSKFDKLSEEISHEICKTCKELDIPLEYNLAGLEINVENSIVGYPHPKFWQIAKEEGNKVIIGVDAHNNIALETNKYYNMALKELNELGLEIVDILDI